MLESLIQWGDIFAPMYSSGGYIPCIFHGQSAVCIHEHVFHSRDLLYICVVFYNVVIVVIVLSIEILPLEPYFSVAFMEKAHHYFLITEVSASYM